MAAVNTWAKALEAGPHLMAPGVRHAARREVDQRATAAPRLQLGHVGVAADDEERSLTRLEDAQ